VFILKQLPDGYKMGVDSHTSSPAFQEDARQLAFQLKRFGSIDDESLLALTHPPHEDTLTMKARNKAKETAAFMAKNPELQMKMMMGGRKK